MKGIRSLIQAIYSVYALLIFIVIMFIALPIVLVSAFFGIKGINFIYTKICSSWARIWYAFVLIKHKEIYETPHDKSGQNIFVANHISYMDIPAIVSSIHQPYRALGKYEMVKIPVFGWIYRAVVVLVDRSSAEARAKSVRALKSALLKHISILLFPEGTFNETGNPLKSFYDGAFRIAIETQTAIKPIILPDTIKRLHYKSAFSLTPGVNRVVYLKEIPVEGYTIDDIQKLKAEVYAVMEEAIIRYQKN